MDEDERRDWDSGTGTPEERNQMWESLKSLWRSIPDPTDDQLQPPYMRPDDWQVCQTDMRARENIFNFYRRQWKKQRKAKAREEQAKQKSEAEPPSAKSKGVNLEDLIRSSETRTEAEKEADRKRSVEAAKNIADAFQKHDEDMRKKAAEWAEQLANPSKWSLSDLWQKAEDGFNEWASKSPIDLEKEILGDQPKGPTFTRIGESSFSEPSVLEKLWKLTESNFFWGGGVGMALAAYAFEISAPRFSICLLVLAWLVFTISIFRHGFFEGKAARRIYEGVISLIIGALLAGIWILLKPVTTQPTTGINLSSPTSIATPSIAQMLPLPTRTPTQSPAPSPSQTPALPKQESTRPVFPSDVKIGLLQCNVSEYDNGYRILKGAVCAAKHEQTGEEFIGTVTEQGWAEMNVPYGLYAVPIKAPGYITQVQAVRVGEEVATVGVTLHKNR